MHFRFYPRHLRHHVFSLLTGFIKSLLPCAPSSSTQIGGLSELGEESGDERDQRKVTINVLPNDVLVEIFHFCVNDFHTLQWRAWTSEWYMLVHVCRRWRNVVFASPRYLNLRLVYTGNRPMSEMLETWPALPVVISHSNSAVPSQPSHLSLDPNWANIAVALDSEHHDRICEIDLYGIPSSHWKIIATAMQKPFPELTHLRILVGDGRPSPVFPDVLLGDFAPRLHMLSLGNGSFPGLKKLLLSAHDLVTLHLWDIPDSRYISPEAVATCLFALTSLKTLCLQFKHLLYHSDPTIRRLPPLSRSVLPSLTKLVFKGFHEYLEDLVSQIDAPFLDNLHIVFFMDLNFDVPQLHRFTNHAEKFTTLSRAIITIFDHKIEISLSAQSNFGTHFVLEIMCQELDWQISSLSQFCGPSSQAFPLISSLEHLEFTKASQLSHAHWDDEMESAQWLELLTPFTAVKSLYLSGGVALYVCHALGDLPRERVTEVLPGLSNLFLRGIQPGQDCVEQFVIARQLSNHTVAVHGPQ